MRLIDVQFLLNFEEEIIHPDTKPLAEFTGPLLASTEYTILSHCWGPRVEEVEFMEMEDLPSMTSMDRDKLRRRKGYQKILRCCQQAHMDSHRWAWVDTCCIDKRSSSELSEAINSMYEWYAKSIRCYAYLHDVHTLEFPSKREERFQAFNGWPMWFSRGWTLQELVAPSDVYFFNREWERIGTKQTLSLELSRITKIPDYILTDGLSSWRPRPSVAQVMSWAANRKTTREEDRAYSLLGILGVHMPMLYGEGKHAFRRLQEEIIRRLNDQTIFTWGLSTKIGWSKNFLADDPSYFGDCDDVLSMTRDEFIEALTEESPQELEELEKLPPECLRTFTLSNDGIQIWMRLTLCRGSTWLYKARLPCRFLHNSSPINITLGCFNSKYFRYFGDFEAALYARVQYQQVFLPYQDNTELDDFTFHLEPRTLSYAGFAQPTLFPRDVQLSGTSVTLSKASDCAILVYCRPDGVYLVIVLRHWLGEHSIHVICEESEGSPLECAQRAYQRTADKILAEASRISKTWLSATSPEHSQLVKRTHLPRSIHDVRLVYSRALRPGSCTVVADIVECTGCCESAWQVLDCKFVALPNALGCMRNAVTSCRSGTYELCVTSHRARYLLTDGDSTVEPGDYGSIKENGHLELEGNIFELATMLGLNIPRRDVKLGIRDGEGAYTKDDLVIVMDQMVGRGRALRLRDATVCSLPDAEDVFFLTTVLSARLQGRHLVTTVIKCSETSYRESGARSWDKDPDFHSESWIKLNPAGLLYTLMTPLVWHRAIADENTRTQFQIINRHFKELLEPDRSAQEKKPAIDYFTDIFGGEHLANLVGNSSFFADLVSLVAPEKTEKSTYNDNAPSIEGMIGRTRPYSVLRYPLITLLGRRRGFSPQRGMQLRTTNPHLPLTRADVDGVQDSPIQTVKRTLIEKLQNSTYPPVATNPNPASTREAVSRQTSEGLILRSFGPQLLLLIGTIYVKSKGTLGHGNSGRDDTKPGKDFAVVYSNALIYRLRELVRRVRELQNHLKAAEGDDNAQRALEEDIAGTILLLCWQGVQFEINQVLTKVVDSIVNDKFVEESVRQTRVERLRNMGEMFVQNATDYAPEHDSSPLQRIFTDAKAGVSKYDLLLAAREKRFELPSQVNHPARTQS